MERKKAIEILTQVCLDHRGTLQEHQIIQEALRTIQQIESNAKLIEKTEELNKKETDDGKTKV
jgi:hypothetical protein